VEYFTAIAFQFVSRVSSIVKAKEENTNIDISIAAIQMNEIILLVMIKTSYLFVFIITWRTIKSNVDG